MLPPKGKSKAASIWSVDSGYASNTLEEDEGSHADFFWDHSSSQQQPSLGSSDLYKVQVEDQLRLQRPDSPTAPVTTKLNVFTAKLGSSSSFLVQTSSVEQECVLCRLWDITNPGENLKCDECSRKANFLSGNIEPFGFEQIPTLVVPQVEPADSLPVEDLSSRNTSGRCSACEISAFINQDQTSTCDSCTPEISSPESLSSTSQVKRSSARRPPTKLESHALRCLKKWLRDHSSNPYPDADTKRDLAQQCGITEKQVTTWFTNARARRRVANYTDTTGSGLEEERTQTIKISNMRAVPALDGSGGYQIINNNQSSEMSRQVSNESSQNLPGSSRRGKKKDYSHLGTSPATEQNPARSFKPSLETIMQNNRAPNMWQCTFCYQSVAPKSWRRHEETQHRPKRRWTCLHTGPLLTIPHPFCSKPTSPTCAFCMLQNPSEEHLHHSHRIQECMSKPEEERTFLRPDHLRQHVKNFHSASLADTVRDLWRRDGGSTRKDGGAELWTCGFCGLEMDTWEKRQSHISGHFKNGATMAEWKCCDAASPDAGTRASRKRPTSSEGRPNVFAKLARNLTGLTTRHQQNLPMCNDTEDCGVGNAQEVKQEEAPLLPDLVFDNFTTGIYGEELHFASGSGTESAEEEALAEEVLGSGVPSGEDVWLGLDEGASTEWKGYSDLLDFW